MGSDYDGRVAFYVVGTSPFESIEQLEEDRKEKDLPWPVAYPDEGMLESLGISSQASKSQSVGTGRSLTATALAGATTAVGENCSTTSRPTSRALAIET